MTKPFRKGIVVPDHKYRSLSSTNIHDIPTPRFVELLLNQHGSAALQPCVREGDFVYAGTKIAEPFQTEGVPLHSSVSGRIAEVSNERITIESDEADRMDPSIEVQTHLSFDANSLIESIREAGLVDLGGSGLPVHTKLLESRERKIETLILNGCESEPFLTADHLLMLNHAVEVLKGVELLRIASGAKEAIIAVEKNKLEAIEILNSKNYNLHYQHIKSVVLPVRYPQGSERVLAESILGRKLKRTETPLEAGIQVENIATAFAVYEAVYLKKPLYERAITISGPCVMEPKTVWALNGTHAIDLIRSAKGFLREADRVLFGGPMTGEAIPHLEIPVTKKVQGILALPHDLNESHQEEPCTRCGLCVDVCPESLIPETLVRAVRKNRPALALEYDIDSCTECGACAFICPSKIPIVSLIRKGKTVLPVKHSEPEPAHVFSTQS